MTSGAPRSDPIPISLTVFARFPIIPFRSREIERERVAKSSVNSNGKKDNILTSWKEIAAYLDRDVRTCVRWEQRYGLPVHRLGRDSKAKVFAYTDEIDRWLQERSALADAPVEPVIRHRRWFHPVAGVFALAGLAAAAYFLFFSRTGPANFRIEGSVLIIVDKHGHDLWSYDTKRKDLLDDATYRDHFQIRSHSTTYQPMWPYIAIHDLNGDGRKEVLLSIKTRSEIDEGLLVVLDDKGHELWSYPVGRALTFGGKPFPFEYRIFGFDVDDFDDDGRPEVLVVSFQKLDWPCQVVLLDAAGRLKGEYWNAGYIMDADLGDVDLDGRKELILAGVNNEYARGCLAVFKPGQLRGMSPQISDEFRSPQLGPGGQSVYVLFPRCDVETAMHVQGDPVNYFWLHKTGGLDAESTEAHIIYRLDASLTCRYVTLSHPFKNLHAEFVKEGRISSTADDAYQNKLRDSFLSFRNGVWTGGPAVDPKEIERLNGRIAKTP